MGFHSRAWSGIGIVVYGETPMMPMKLEQAISTASPDNEIRLESFEHYEDALDYCGDSKDTGLILLAEPARQHKLDSVFANLTAPYEGVSGFPGFAVLLADGSKTLEGYEICRRTNRVIEYIDAAEILQPHRTRETLDRIWMSYTEAFQAHVLPDPLRRSLVSVAQKGGLSPSTQVFAERMLHLLGGTLNISWLDSFCMRWVPEVNAVQTTCPEIVTPHATMKQIASLGQQARGLSEQPTSSLINSKGPLPQRLCALIMKLEIARQNHQLAELIGEIKAMARPGAPALCRTVARCDAEIMRIADESQDNTAHRERGAA